MALRVLVCGGRAFSDGLRLWKILDANKAKIGVVIHGAARGADTLAGLWATARGVPQLAYPADWQRHGRSAGPRRNRQMLVEAKPDLVVAFPGGPGTAHMVRIAREAGVRVIEIA